MTHGVFWIWLGAYRSSLKYSPLPPLKDLGGFCYGFFMSFVLGPNPIPKGLLRTHPLEQSLDSSFYVINIVIYMIREFRQSYDDDFSKKSFSGFLNHFRGPV